MLQTTKTITASPPAATVNADGTISCQVCGERHKALHRHVLKHGLTSVTYQTKYPGAPLVAPGVQIGRPPKVETDSPPRADANAAADEVKSVPIGTKPAARDATKKGKRAQAKNADLVSLEAAAITAWSNLDRHMVQTEDSAEACSYLTTIYSFVRAAVLDPQGFRALNSAGGKGEKVKAPRAGTANAQYLHPAKYIYAAMSKGRKLERKRAAEGKRKDGDGRTTAWRYAKAFRWCGEEDMTAEEFKEALDEMGVYGLAQAYDEGILPHERPDPQEKVTRASKSLKELKASPIVSSKLKGRWNASVIMVADSEGLRQQMYRVPVNQLGKLIARDDVEEGVLANTEAMLFLARPELEVIAKALANAEVTAERDSAAKWVAEGLRSLEGNDAQPGADA